MSTISIDVLQIIHDQLPADDRVRMRSSSKYFNSISVKNEKHDTIFGILLNNIKKGTIQGLDKVIVKHIAKRCANDLPTLDFIADYFPNLKDDLNDKIATCLDKIENGTCTSSDLSAIDPDTFEIKQLINLINRTDIRNIPDIFELVYNRFESVRVMYTDYINLINFMRTMIIYLNRPLLDHLKTFHPVIWQSICTVYKPYILESYDLLDRTDYIEVTLMYLPFSNEEKHKLALACLTKHMYLEGYELLMR
jgi:hypothetical protein